jgi:hypothetical protein
MAPTAKGNVWPAHSFVEAYNSKRYNSSDTAVALAADGYDTTELNTKINSVQLHAPVKNTAKKQASRFSTSSVRTPQQVNTNGYMPIRSDVDDEAPEMTTKLPLIPDSMHGLVNAKADGQGLKLAETKEDSAGRFPWVESTWFQGLSGMVILANAIVIGLETDFESPLFFWVEQALMFFFVTELIIRLTRYGMLFFQHEDDWAWNSFDFVIVMSGVFDTWLMPLATKLEPHRSGHEKKGSKVGVVFMLMRMLRLFRIVRLFRLLRIVRPLFELAMGIMEALQGMGWVLVLLMMMLYACSILCTRLIGKSDIMTGAASEEVDEIKKMFGSVFDSMFTLFGTISSWSLTKYEPLFVAMPVLRWLFMLFYVYLAWALLAIMTGVVSENMIAIRDQMIAEDKHKDEIRKATITELLLDLFRKADADNDGTLARDEFTAMIGRPELVKKIQKNTHMNSADMTELFDILDHDGSGTITIEEFMNGFKWLNEPLRAKSLVKLQERLCTDLRNLETNLLRTIRVKAEVIRQTVTQPLRKVYAVTEQLQNLDAHFSELRTVVKEHADALPSEQELRDVEGRLAKRLGHISAHLAEVEARAQQFNRTEEPKSPPPRR